MSAAVQYAASPINLVAVMLLWFYVSSCIAVIICLNGGTYDSVLDTCNCPATAYGTSCETLLDISGLCSNISALPAIRDPNGYHAAGNPAACTSGCVDFSVLTEGWYHVESPYGNKLVDSYPCTVGGASIGCGATTALTLRSKLKTFTNSSGTLYSAIAYPFNTATTNCFSSSAVFYAVRILECVNNNTIYYLGPTGTAKTKYCIGIWVAPTTTAQTTASSLTPTGISSTNAGGTATSGLTTTSGSRSTPYSNQTGAPTGRQTSPTQGLTSTVSPSTAGGWNILANDTSTTVKVPLRTASGYSSSAMSCSVRSNSAVVSFTQNVTGFLVAGSWVECDLSTVILWLRESRRIYLNCMVEVLGTALEVTVCQTQFSGKSVRYQENRSQCIPDGFDDSAVSSYEQWFGVGWNSAKGSSLPNGVLMSLILLAWFLSSYIYPH